MAGIIKSDHCSDGYEGIVQYLRPIVGLPGFCCDLFHAARFHGARIRRSTTLANKQTVIVTGASQGIGAAIVQSFLDHDYQVVATSRSVTKARLVPSPNLALVDGDIGKEATAEKVTETALAKFGSIDHVVNNAGIFSVKPFTEYTAEEFRASSPRTWKGSSSSPNSR